MIVSNMEKSIQDLKLTVTECTVFYSFLRLRCLISDEAGYKVSAELVRTDDVSEKTVDPAQSASSEHLADSPHHTIEVQALIDRGKFPTSYALALMLDNERVVVPAADLVAMETALYARSSLNTFKEMATRETRIAQGGRPRLLDLGGRARSGNVHGNDFPECDVTVFDIRAEPGVDVVGDIHAMTNVLARDSFDLILCVSVFEHLIMPWKAALEINHVLRPGGLAFILTHQTVGMHDIPWDYCRFSDASWAGLFNASTGFEIKHTMMSQFVHVVPQHYCAAAACSENAGGFLESVVIVQKIGPTTLTWPVELNEIVDTIYPS